MTGLKKCKVAVLISGRGSNLQALIDAAKSPDYPADIALVISNKADALGLDVAKAAGIAAHVIVQNQQDGKTQFEAGIQQTLEKAGIALVCLAGFMRILSPEFLKSWDRRIINIHPSLLPLLPGLDTHRRALDTKMSQHGCSVHYVTAEVDAGEVIAQARVPVEPDDTEETLAARVLAAEHALYPRTLALVAERLCT